MTKIVKAVFLSDVHLPRQIKLGGVFQYIKDFRPDEIILGGDIIDAGEMHGVESWPASKFKVAYYRRDLNLFKWFIQKLWSLSPKAKIVYLEGNHEERYQRLARNFPDLFGDSFNFERDGVPSNRRHKFTWIPYGDYYSFYTLGDCLFTHGTIYPDNHAKKMAMAYTPKKMVYGHLHDYQAYTTHTGIPTSPSRFAVTPGCLCGRLPDYKKGHPNKWNHGFASIMSINGCTLPTVHHIEKGIFNVGPKIYTA